MNELLTIRGDEKFPILGMESTSAMSDRYDVWFPVISTGSLYSFVSRIAGHHTNSGPRGAKTISWGSGAIELRSVLFLAYVLSFLLSSMTPEGGKYRGAHAQRASSAEAS